MVIIDGSAMIVQSLPIAPSYTNRGRLVCVAHFAVLLLLAHSIRLMEGSRSCAVLIPHPMVKLGPLASRSRKRGRRRLRQVAT